jgi:Flp pilus assembly secretin CpaC
MRPLPFSTCQFVAPLALAPLAVAAFLAGSLPAVARPLDQVSTGTTVVQINHSQRLALSGAAAQVFVGNPAIADVAVVNHNTLMLTGKAYGLTNLQVLDHAGRTILNREVQVSANTAGAVTLYRGAKASNYTCAPACQSLDGGGSGGPAAPAGPAATPGGGLLAITP